MTQQIACAPTDPDIAAALVDSRLWTTVDGGSTWRMGDLYVAGRPTAPAADDASDNAADTLESLDEDDDEAESTDGVFEGDPLADTAAIRSIAISDDACFAFATGDNIVLGCRGTQRRRSLDIAGARRIRFDPKHNLWAITSDGLVFFEDPFGGHQRRRVWRLPGPRALVQGDSKTALVVLDRRGALEIQIDGNALGPGKRLGISGADTASVKRFLASDKPVDDDGAIYFTAYGQLKKRRRDGQVVLVGDVPPKASELLVDVHGGIYLLSRSAGWLEMSDSGEFRPVGATALAVDAAGRVWSGTDVGPAGPLGDAARARPDDELPPHRVTRERQAPIPSGVAWRVELPDPPRCHRLELSALPRITAVARYGKGAAMHRGVGLMEDEGGVSSEVFLGVALTWTWSGHPPAACLHRHERFQEETARMNKKTAFLVSAWNLARSHRNATQRIREAIADRMETERLAHLLLVMGGVDLQKEIR